MLRHFLHGKGADFYLSAGDIRSANAYRTGMEQNRERFEQSLSEGSPHPFIKQIKALEDGQTILLQNPDLTGTPLGRAGVSDYWDDDIGAFTSLRKDRGVDLDQFASLGSAKLRSAGTFTATRKGTVVEVRGQVDHGLDNTYDFNGLTLFDNAALSGLKRMQDEGYATPFRVRGTASERLVATLEIRDGKVVNPQYTWADIK